MKLHYWPSPALRQIARPLSQQDDHRELVDSLFDVMRKNDGIGLAATQCGVDLQLFVAEIAVGGRPLFSGVFGNPEIIAGHGTVDSVEGCLSFPGVSLAVKRYSRVDVRYWDPIVRGSVETTLTGLPAICFQHECQHLQGILFIDHVSPFRRRRALAQMKHQL